MGELVYFPTTNNNSDTSGADEVSQAYYGNFVQPTLELGQAVTDIFLAPFAFGFRDPHSALYYTFDGVYSFDPYGPLPKTVAQQDGSDALDAAEDASWIVHTIMLNDGNRSRIFTAALDHTKINTVEELEKNARAFEEKSLTDPSLEWVEATGDKIPSFDVMAKIMSNNKMLKARTRLQTNISSALSRPYIGDRMERLQMMARLLRNEGMEITATNEGEDKLDIATLNLHASCPSYGSGPMQRLVRPHILPCKDHFKFKF